MKKINISFFLLIFSMQYFQRLSCKTYDYREDNLLNTAQYLVTKEFKNKNGCFENMGSISDITDSDLNEAFFRADQQINEVIVNTTEYVEKHPFLKSFNSYLYKANLKAKYNEFATKNLVINKCLSKYEAESSLRYTLVSSPYGNNFCDVESDVSPIVKCNRNYKYSRMDGKCNNLVNTNWGSSFHCQRRMQLPDYADGVNEPRVASSGSALPNPRLITNLLMPRYIVFDPVRSSMHMEWGQLLAHDVSKTIQQFGLGFAIDCCADDSSLMHQDCMAIKNFPPDMLSSAFNQTCMIFVRSMSCNTCSLGYREQINAATSTLDLSNFYGGNNNNSDSLRTFKRGAIKKGAAIDGSDILHKAVMPEDQDDIDLGPCNVPSDQPWFTCLVTGDGIRGNQQPMIMAMHIIMRRRHMQHARALSEVNPHWNDETLYQEARRLLIAEVNKIHFDEYFPSVLNKETLDFYQLNVKTNGFTQYEPYVNPTTINSVGVAAFRFGHSQVTSRFQVIKKPKHKSYGFKLRFRYNQMIDIWEGNTNGIIEGLSAVPSRAVDSYVSPDVHDFLAFSEKTPTRPGITDLMVININRGRDHGIPAYVYFVKQCTGILIKSWMHLNQLIAEDYIKQIASIYKDVKDVDLIVGGLAERPMNGSILGPTFSCLIGIQAYHWKWGDRFYFEHGGQAGSFTLEQLNNIRRTASLANLLCKTTDIDSIPSKPMFMSSNTNPKISCKQMSEFNYDLWHQN